MYICIYTHTHTSIQRCICILQLYFSSRTLLWYWLYIGSKELPSLFWKKTACLLGSFATENCSFRVPTQQKQTKQKKTTYECNELDTVLGVARKVDCLNCCFAFEFEICCVSQCVAMCCNVLQCVAVRCSLLQRVAVCCSVLQCVAVCCSVLQCIAVCCSVLQCVAVCCSVLQWVGVCSLKCLFALEEQPYFWRSLWQKVTCWLMVSTNRLIMMGNLLY